MASAVVFGVLAAAGIALAAGSGALARARPRINGRGGDSDSRSPRGSKPAGGRRLSSLMMVQIVAASGLGFAGWAGTGLLGMVLLLGGLGALLPPFMAAPARRRRQTRQALAWSLWSRQIAELARAGSGLADSIRGSTEHAPEEIAPIVARIAATAEMRSLEEALDELAASGTVWEPEVAAGLRMAASSGGAVADPLLDLCGRISDVVDLHRSKSEAVVQLWTQTIALLGLAGGVVVLMYRNNPAYFEPYEQGTGQLVFVGIAGMLLMSTAFLVYHSVVREENSILVEPRRRSRAKDPI
ncbi:type II secretion system F family protein [Candidatus Poriferisodalis sp.]|uniref:type II secretion system F family protein n=1 Tax=Candidatus Poriferisodalis sp. TaxID=3101277 RepID=UPI003C6F3A6B